MKVKTYRAPTLQAALKEIKQELGPDAFILAQKQIRPTSLLGKMQKAQIEVTAAVDHSSEPARPAVAPEKIRTSGVTGWADAVDDRVSISRPPSLPEPSPRRAPENEALLDEVRKLKAMVRSISSQRQQTAVFLKPRKFTSPASRQLYARLAVHGIDENLAHSLSSVQGASNETAAATVASRMNVFPDFIPEAGKGSPEIVALLGPTGVGKTTTIAKIAAIAALQRKLKVGLLTLDTFRIAAIAQLKTYAEIMGVPMRAVENVQELQSAIQAFSDRDLILIDTTGRNHREICHEWELAEFLADSNQIRKALVVSATTRTSDLTDVVERYGIFKPNCLIFTKLDETDTHGAIVSELLRSGLPIAYVTTGQAVPNDIVKPEARQLADLAIGPDREASWNLFINAAPGTESPRQPAAKPKASRRLVQ